MSIRITFSDAARETAEIYSTVAALETQARREIAAVLGRATLKTFNERSMYLIIDFEHAGDQYRVKARTTDTWIIDTLGGEAPCPRYPLVFSDRATALINGLGWTHEGIEQHARIALRGTFPEDYGFCDFRVPIEEVAFVGRLNELDTVEIDLDDFYVACAR